MPCNSERYRVLQGNQWNDIIERTSSGFFAARQLAGWEKTGLFPVRDCYSFFDLLQIKKLRDLRAKRVRSAVILDSLRAMQQQVAGMENPLLEAGTFATKSRVAFRHHGSVVEPLAGQFVMDFARTYSGGIAKNPRHARRRNRR
jgi:hypothetical protein